MIVQPGTLRQRKFLLKVPFNQLKTLYPHIAQQVLNKYEKNQQNKLPNSPYVRLEMVMYYSNKDKQPISYKLIKTQRLLTILSRLSRSFGNFLSVIEVLKLQNSSQKPNNKIQSSSSSFKGQRGLSRKQTSQNRHQEPVQYYSQKGWNIFQHFIHQYSAIITVLRQSPSSFLSNRLQNKDFRLQQLRTLFKRSLHKSIENFQKQQLTLQKKQEAIKQLKLNIIQFIRKISQKYESIIRSIIERIEQLALSDTVIKDFLNGSHKFYKLDIFQIGELYNFRNTKIQEKLQQNIQFAAKHLFRIFINQQTPFNNNHSINKSNFNSNQNLTLYQQQKSYQPQKQLKQLKHVDVENLSFLLDWNLQDIQKSSLYLQSIHLFINSKNEKQTINVNIQESIQFLTRRFVKELKKMMILDSYQLTNKIFTTEDFLHIQNYLDLQNVFLTLKRKQKKNNQAQERLKIMMNERYTEQNILQPQSFQQQQMSIINKKIDEQQQKQLQNILSNETSENMPIFLTENQSLDLLSLFYNYYFTTMHCFLSCEKQWYFSNQKVKDHNMSDHYNTMVRWIPIENRERKNNQKKVYGQYSTFLSYLSSLVYTLLEVKNRKVIKQEQNDNKMQDQNNNKQVVKSSYFIYNDLLNCLVYDNFSFENIQHCHYYLRNCNNDKRHQFQDRGWVDLMNNQSIRLCLKLDSQKQKRFDIKNSCSQQMNTFLTNQQNEEQKAITESVRLISMPVRGRYCRHIDFFDLSQVYGQIFPTSYCPPQTFTCPKCFIDIQFEQLIYLKEVQTVLQFIKMFYLENDKIERKSHLKNDHLNVDSCKSNQNNQKIKQKIKPVPNQYHRTQLTELSQQKYILKDIRLIINHKKQSVSIKGNYLIIQNQINPIFQQDFNCLTQYKIQDNLPHLKNLKFTTHQFQYPLESEIYQTLLNPNKQFRSIKKLKGILSNYGKTTKNKFNLFSNFPKQMNEFIFCELSFNQQINLALKITSNRWQLYKDLEKGTIAI